MCIHRPSIVRPLLLCPNHLLTHCTGFQASKFFGKRDDIAERIRHLPSPRDALQEATRLARLRRSDWFEVNVGIMDEILEAKFTQHRHLREMLLGTEDREIVEASPVRNLVDLWSRVEAELKSQDRRVLGLRRRQAGQERAREGSRAA